MRHFFLLSLSLLGTSEWLCPRSAEAFPENVRHGYASCGTCHANPTGAGALTPYGRSASGELVGTWFSPQENDPLHGLISLPEALILGGDIRELSTKVNASTLQISRTFLMQTEIELGVKTSQITALGAADCDEHQSEWRSRRHYLLKTWETQDRSWFVRAGRFMPAFGIVLPEHTVATRRGLGFDIGDETYNAEFGITQETGEWVVTGILKPGREKNSQTRRGFSTRAAWYAGGKSQLGLSFLQDTETLWERSAGGAFVITGLTSSAYLLAELDFESKKPRNTPSASFLTSRSRIVTYNKAGIELLRGLYGLGFFEASVPKHPEMSGKFWSIGSGLQWFPRPHFELLGQVQWRKDETWPGGQGNMWTMMGHYYL